MMVAALLAHAAVIASSPDLGKAEGQCHANENGPALLISVNGIKDRRGLLKAEVYPPTDPEFLGDDNVLLMAGKTFRRVEQPVPQAGPIILCIRVPGPGTYAVSLLHDRDSNRRFTLLADGVGCASNPRMRWGQPKAAQCLVVAGATPTRLTITLNYFRGLGGFGPLKD
jgi:uncharacterized protein (DUF2141 family)